VRCLARWNRTVNEECLSKLILFGETSLRHVLSNYARHYHEERNRPCKDNRIFFPVAPDRLAVHPARSKPASGSVVC